MTVQESMLRTIGNTPVVKLSRVVSDGAADVLVKLEWFSPTGSYKDRMALAMIENAEQRGDLRPGMTVVEYTGGSTGGSLAYICAVKGYRFRVVSSDAVAEEKLRTMVAFGAELTIVESVGGKITPDLVPRMIEKAAEYAAEPDTYWTDQLKNSDSLDGYHQIGTELLAQVDVPIDAFCATVGTAGLTMGVSRGLREGGSDVRITLLELAQSPVISTGEAGTHDVEGIGIGFRPPLLDEDRYDDIRLVDEADGVAMARRLAAEEGLLAGVSSGCNIAGAIALAQELGPGKTVCTVAVDTGLKYLAGHVFQR